MKVSLGFIIALSLAGLQFLAIITVVSTSYLTSERAMLQHARDLLAEVGANASEHSVGFLKPALETARLTSKVIESGIVESDDVAELEQLLFETLQSQPQLSGIYHGDEDGNFVYVMRSDGPGPFRTKTILNKDTERTVELVWRDARFTSVDEAFDPSDTFDPRERPWYVQARDQGEPVWTDPYIFFSSQEPGISVASPISVNGTVTGVIGVDIEIATISEFLSGLVFSDRGSAVILNQNGDVIAHPDLDQIVVEEGDGQLTLAGIDQIDDAVARRALGNLGAGGRIEVENAIQSEFDFESETYVSLLKPIQGSNLPWTIAIFAPENDFIGDISENRRRNIWIAAAISLVTACLGLLLAGLILKPVRAFAVRTALVSQGEMSATEPLPGTYKELTKANETLIDEIAQRREADEKILELNRELSHFSRVSLMGQMATGLAHELSQPLTAITQNVDTAISIAKQQENAPKELLDILSELDEQAHLGGDVLHALRGFVRKDQGEMKPFDPNELLRQTERLMHNELEARNVTLTINTKGAPEVLGTRIQIAQVLINLIRNAMEAISDANSPKKEITISTLVRDDSFEICVDDTGPGIDPDVTLFKQFETSKNDGMGLGLSISRTIAETNGGRLWYDTRYTNGARFCLSLPRHNKAPNP